MNLGLDENIFCFNIESEPELEALSRAASARGAVAPIAIRVNPDVDARTHAKIATGKKENKFGIDLTHAAGAVRRAAQLPGLSTVGIAVHIGSQLTELAPFELAFHRVAELMRALREEGFALPRLDLGGGLGIPYRLEALPPIAHYPPLSHPSTPPPATNF